MCIAANTSCLFAHPLLLLLLLLLPQTTKVHITLQDGVVEELVVDEGLQVTSCSPFKGDMD
jgi:NAD/NADP transhydrogenase alpha subunit